MKLRILKTSKLYYNEWPYKIACAIDGASRLARQGPSDTKKFCSEATVFSRLGWPRQDAATLDDKIQLLQFTNKVEPFLDIKDQVRIRVEGRHFNMFCKDLALLETIYESLEPWVVNVYGPDNEQELKFMLSNDNKKITCDHLPHNKYQFKVYLRNNMQSDSRDKFLGWSKTYQDRILISKTTIGWLSSWTTYRWTQCPFLYVEDARSLTMIGLFLGGNIKKVEEFIPRSSINTILDQE